MYYYGNTISPYHYYTDGYNMPITQQNQGDERFFGFGILPFVAGLAVAPLLFNNRPCCPPYLPPYPPPYGSYPPPYAYPQNYQPQPYNPMYGNIHDTINIYTK